MSAGECWCGLARPLRLSRQPCTLPQLCHSLTPSQTTAPNALPPPLPPSPVVPQPDPQSDHSVQRAPLTTTPHAPDAERRQLTVMFCDLVDSTTLARSEEHTSEL